MDNGAQYGLIGYPLGHSFSADYFNAKFEREHITGVTYENFPLHDITGFPALIADRPRLRGFNVTIPYKERIIGFLDRLDPAAAQIGAVNCVVVGDGATLTGYNTDAPAFRCEVLDLIGDERPRALILGTGGASKAVAYTLQTLGVDYATISRTSGCGSYTYHELTPEIISDRRLIINATPLGMYPDVDVSPPIPYDALTPEHRLFDLIYNPLQTTFMQEGLRRGAKTVNGYGMLVGQAELSWKIWTNGAVDID